MVNRGAIAKAGITAAALYAAAFALRSATVELRHFSASEFGLWWPLMDSNLLLGLCESHNNARKESLTND